VKRNFSVARERCYQQIAAAVVKYQETKKNINDGLNFYVTLQVRVHLHCILFLMYDNIVAVDSCY
jgi:programmed cell death 6-interacting protein